MTQKAVLELPRDIAGERSLGEWSPLPSIGLSRNFDSLFAQNAAVSETVDDVAGLLFGGRRRIGGLEARRRVSRQNFASKVRSYIARSSPAKIISWASGSTRRSNIGPKHWGSGSPESLNLCTFRISNETNPDVLSLLLDQGRKHAQLSCSRRSPLQTYLLQKPAWQSGSQPRPKSKKVPVPCP